MRYHLYREQQLNCNIEEVWDFFSSPLNLSKITPQDMKFTVLSDLKNTPIYEGMEIDYLVSPVLGIPLQWKTRITQVNYKKSFTDLQAKGPYRYWNHYHEFIENDKGVLMKDSVDYELPFGLLGKLAHSLFVHKRLKSIFEFRYNFLEGYFNRKN
ncbi:SRPBCC family protein [Elizabethkingia anophelis]|uniref:SRPBCC family protein n=1 Tax=Elizabethkingia anophelis TaxID=1117645 RepID=UPI000442AFB0|nr:SRPBCC family protein [Elizabethkingia anophelis]MCT3834623.1 SRPBCC family protein [Elizabethkingia anophelis]MCT3944672.1 SRPBCC family protein [Elizabethkingia anophelis]MCT3977889.1 SRPBCC family protein [Elizabethkingia anophelis]MCT3994451.1 SRPBCC family protein [Elizabethkingia anophelis]MCT3997941.1 SRPBCC family protein [Elizabethkingia anophelis]